MADVTTPLSIPQTESELKVAIDQCFEELERLREQMGKDQIEIDRLKAETRAILAELKAA